MALQKVDYVNQVTVITAENMNDIQDAIIALETAPSQGLSEDVKQALLQLAQKVAYIDAQGQTYYDDLYNAFYPPKTVVLITAVFEQGSTVIYDDTALDDLKQYLTVTAKYDDNTTAILPDASYTLSGLLEAGTSTVTVAYNGLTTTFTVNVTARPTLSSISAVYNQSGTVYDTDTLDSLKDDLVVTAHYSDSSTQTVPAADYTLSGTLTVGTSTITVSYGGKTTTFSVTVSEAPLLPTEYQQVEYIKATGTQYMYTGLTVYDHPSSTNPDSIDKYTIDIDFQFDEWQSNYATNIMAGFGAAAGKWIGYANSVSNIAMGTTSGMYFSGTPTDRHQYHYEAFVSGNNAKWTRDDGATITRSFTGVNGDNMTLSLFYVVVTSGTQSDFHFNGKLFACTAYKLGEKVMDLIPCYRKADGEIGLYDTVGNHFYTNEGTGTFLKGADVA